MSKNLFAWKALSFSFSLGLEERDKPLCCTIVSICYSTPLLKSSKRKPNVHGNIFKNIEG